MGIDTVLSTWPSLKLVVYSALKDGPKATRFRPPLGRRSQPKTVKGLVQPELWLSVGSRRPACRVRQTAATSGSQANRASGSGGGGGSDFSVVVVGSDFATDAGAALLAPADREVWHDCLPDLAEADACFFDLEERQVVRVQGTDRAGRTIVRVVGKFFPASVIDGERLKKYVFYKLRTELPVGPFCILYMHSTVQSDDNNPGMSILRTIYEELPPEYKERLQVFYFLHPGLRSRLAIATLGRLFLSGGLYWKIKYISRLEYLWGDIKRGEVEIPDFVIEHDKVLEHRPLTDYGIEPDPLHLADVPAVGYSLGRYEDKWTPENRWYSRNYM